MTGGGFGFCTPNQQAGGFRRTAPGTLGAGRGFFCRGGGMGRGFRNMYYATGQPAWARNNAGYAPYSREAEIEALENNMKNMQQRLEELKNENSDNS
jgi:hypothetical protein